MGQESVAASLPVEILLAVFSYFVEEDPDYLEVQYADAKRGKDYLPIIALVCVRWRRIADMLLYQHVRISSLKSLGVLRRTLKSRGNMEMQKFSYRSSDVTENDNAKRKWKAEKNLLEEICGCLQDVSLNFKLIQSSSDGLLLQSNIGMNVTSLHIVASSTSGTSWDVFPYDVAIPRLESLTLDTFVLDEIPSWPCMPNLQCLRLISCALFEVADSKAMFEPMCNLKRLELHHVHYQADSFPQLLKLCAPTLEQLVVLDVSGPNLASTMGDLRSCSSLKKLYIGPHAFPIAPLTFNMAERFPPSLEELAIYELSKPIFVFWPLDVLPNTVGLEKMLDSFDASTSLKRICVQGHTDQWKERKTEFEKKCQRVEVQFKLDLVKGMNLGSFFLLLSLNFWLILTKFTGYVETPVRSSTWRQRTWRSVRNKIRRARHAIPF